MEKQHRKNDLTIIVMLSFVIVNGCTQKCKNDLVYVQGGLFTNPHSQYYGKIVIVQDFYISRYEITQEEWVDVMGTNPSMFRGDDRPVEMVSWYECIEYCNKRSIKEGLIPYYTIDKGKKDTAKRCDTDSLMYVVTIHEGANGYRLPTEIEWEYAASGGQKSRHFLYSGSDSIEEVGWYWRNSGDRYLAGMWSWSDIEKNHCSTKPVGRKKPNELGLFDMSGNVREWCWDWEKGKMEDCGGRLWKGGGWIGVEFCCAIPFRGFFDPSGKGPDQGFRICRSK